VGIECLRAYRRKWDEELRQFTDQPVHDWSSHGSDAFRYLALVAKERIVRTVSPTIIRAMPPQPVQYSLDQLWEMNKTSARSRNRI
jgi:hypothetical protein